MLLCYMLCSFMNQVFATYCFSLKTVKAVNLAAVGVGNAVNEN